MIKSKFRSLAIMNLAGFIGVVAVNALANIIPIKTVHVKLGKN